MLYPVFINLHERHCIVVGAGSVAERRVKGLLEHGARVHVIAPEATPGLAQLFEEKKISWTCDTYKSEYLDGSFLVVAATDSSDVNRDVTQDANVRNLLVCRVDNGDDGNYVTGSSIIRGALQISLTTAGASPTLSAVLKARLESEFGEEWAVWPQLLSEIRSSIQSVGTETERRAVVNEILNDKIICKYVEDGLVAEAKKAALTCISSHLA